MMQTGDWIRLIAELIGAGIVGGGIILAMRVSIAVLSTKVDQQNAVTTAMAQELRKISEILARLAVYDEKFNGIDRRFSSGDERVGRIEGRVNELAHGESFVLPLKRGAHEK